MKPTHIQDTLDITVTIRNQRKNFIPCYVGHSGIGKSFNIQLWITNKRKQNPSYGFLDLRLGYFEGPDLIGSPIKTTGKDGIIRTSLALPSFWPTEGAGLLLLEEPNKAPIATLNCIMQLLTDRKIHDYTLPEEWIIAAAINPDLDIYSVNAMDAALTNRFCMYSIEYEKVDFLTYIRNSKWSPILIRFIADIWQYKEPENLGPEETYVSPRNWETINSLEASGIDKNSSLFMISCINILGDNIGSLYYSYCKSTKELPTILVRDLISDKAHAISQIKKYSSTKNHRADQLNITIESILEHHKEIEEDILIAVAEVMPADLAIRLLTDFCNAKYGNNATIKLRNLLNQIPSLLKTLQENV